MVDLKTVDSSYFQSLLVSYSTIWRLDHLFWKNAPDHFVVALQQDSVVLANCLNVAELRAACLLLLEGSVAVTNHVRRELLFGEVCFEEGQVVEVAEATLHVLPKHFLKLVRLDTSWQAGKEEEQLDVFLIALSEELNIHLSGHVESDVIALNETDLAACIILCTHLLL